MAPLTARAAASADAPIFIIMVQQSLEKDPFFKSKNPDELFESVFGQRDAAVRYLMSYIAESSDFCAKCDRIQLPGLYHDINELSK